MFLLAPGPCVKEYIIKPSRTSKWSKTCHSEDLLRITEKSKNLRFLEYLSKFLKNTKVQAATLLKLNSQKKHFFKILS